MKKRKTVVIAFLLLLLVSLLAWLRPPSPASPYLKFAPSASVKLEVLLKEEPTLAFCKTALTTVIEHACKQEAGCRVLEQTCLMSLGTRLQVLRGDEPIDKASVRFQGADMLIDSLDQGQANALCREIEKQAGGRCYFAGETRESVQLKRSDLATFVNRAVSAPMVTKFLLSAFLFSLVASLLIVATKKWHGRFTFGNSQGVQKFHVAPVPRVGGVAIALALMLSAALMPRFDIGFYAGTSWILFYAALVVFCFGLLEDLTGKVGVGVRFVATLASSVLGWWLLGVSLRSVGIAPLDSMLEITLISVGFTAFSIAGLTNAINIIDGFHGLAAGSVALMMSAFAAVAYLVGDTKLALFSGLMIALTLGFLAVNYPFGKLFLGDSGAYLLGFLLGSIAVLLPERNPEVSPWASLLICAYPILETLFTIIRRAAGGLGIAEPDRAHLHSLVKLGLVMPAMSNFSSDFRNSAVAPPLWGFVLLTGCFGILFYQSTFALMLGFSLSAVAYWLFYRFCRARLDSFEPRAMNST